MLTGNKFYQNSINASPLAGEVNYADWGETPSVGSSYRTREYGKSYGRHYNAPSNSSMGGGFDKYQFMNVPTNNPYKTIDNYKYALGAVGQTPPQRKGVGLGNALMTVLDFMQRPQYMVTNVLDEVTDKEKSSFGDVLRAGFEGLSGARKSSTTDVFDNLGWENDSSKKWYQGGNLARNVLGFAGDVLLDPSTYLTAGTASLAKGTAKGIANSTLGESIQKVLLETGHEAMTKSSDDLIRGITDVLSDKSDDIVANMASRTATEKYVTDALGKQGKNSTLISQIAYVLGHTTDDTSDALLKNNKDVIRGLLDNGIGSINHDTITNAMSTPLKQQLDNLMKSETVAGSVEAFNRSVGQAINKKMGGAFSFQKAELKTLKDFNADNIYKLNDILKATKTAVVDDASKNELITKLYAKAGETLDPAAKIALNDKEFNVLDTLMESFNVSSKLEAEQLLRSARDMARMGNRSVKRFDVAVTGLKQSSEAVRTVAGGIEFANGIQRVFDTADKAFYLKYHNPFTGTVKPLVDLSNVAHSEKAKAAWTMLAEMSPISPLLDKAGKKISKLGVGVAEKFNTEYISKGIDVLDDGTVNLDRRVAGKKFAQKVTQFIRKENAIPRRAVESLRIFNSVPEFFDDAGLRQAASIYIERNNSPLAKAGWLYLSGEPLDGADDAVLKAYDHLINSPHLKGTLDEMKFNPVKLELVKKIGQQNTLFNEALAQFDGANKVDFLEDRLNYIRVSQDDISPTDYITRASTGNIDRSALEGYARIYDNTDNAMKNPASEPHQKKIDMEEISAKDLGKRVDSRASATSDTTGAFQPRANKSALDALAANPTHVIDFDMATRASRRVMESERVALNKKFIESIDDFYNNVPGFDTLVSFKKEDGFDRIALMDGKVELWAHPEIANQLSRVASVFDNASVAEKAVDEVFANMSNVLKSLQTKYNPSFIIRNLIGEPLMNWVAGVSKEAHSDAFKIMRQLKDEGLFKIGDTTFALDTAGDTKKLFREYTTEIQPGVKKNVLEYMDSTGTKEVADTFDINAQRQGIIESAGVNPTYYQMGNRKMTAMEIMQEFYDAGLGWSGVTKGNQAKNMRGMLEQEVLKVTHKNGVVNAAKTLNEKIGAPGDFTETWTRLAHYIDSLQKGMDMQSAAMEVRKFHVDYKDLTQFERKYLRNLMPYYTYMRKNFPIQVKLLLERQNKVNMIGQLVDSMYEAVERDNGGKPLDVPDYLKEGLAIPFNVDDDGNVQYLNWGVPIADVGRFKYDLRELMTENFFSMWSPMVKAPLEYSMNQTMMYGSDLESYEGEGKELLPGVQGSPRVSALTDQLIQSLGIVNTARNAVATGMATAQQGGNGVQAGLGKFVTGSILPTKNQEDVALQQAYSYRDQLYAYIQSLRQQGIDVPRYTPDLQYGTPILTPWAASNRVQQEKKQGYLGVPNAQLYPLLLKYLTGQGR